MCNISNIYNADYINKHLENNKFLIANGCHDYTAKTFNTLLSLYNKHKDDFLCDWFPSLWAIVFYRNKEIRQTFLETMNIQLDPDEIVNMYTPHTIITINDNCAVVDYRTDKDYIILDEEKDVG